MNRRERAEANARTERADAAIDAAIKEGLAACDRALGPPVVPGEVLAGTANVPEVEEGADAGVIGPRELYELRIRLIDKHRARERAIAHARKARMVKRAVAGTIALAVCLAGGAVALWGAR